MAKYKDLKDLRYQNGRISQREMAEKIGITEGAYSLIEGGKRVGSHRTWVKIQSLFKLTDDEVWKLQKSK